MRVTELSLPWKRLFAEFGVIVAGVLIALAVDSWWERQQEQKQAEQYLQQLLVDFQDTQRRLQGTIAGDSTMLERVNSHEMRSEINGVRPNEDVEAVERAR